MTGQLWVFSREWVYLLPRWPSTRAGSPGSSALRARFALWSAARMQHSQLTQPRSSACAALPASVPVLCMLCQGTEEIRSWCLGLLLFSARCWALFFFWGLSARTGFCSVLARCLSPGWAGCAALAGADSRTTCCGTSADGAFLSQLGLSTVVCLLCPPLRKGQCKPWGW